MLQIITMDVLDEIWWPKAQALYHASFPHGCKPDAIIEVMFERRLSFLHLLVQDNELLAMAISGITGPSKSLLLIDYLAVQQDRQGQGIGTLMVKEIKRWAELHDGLSGMIVEVEAEVAPDNLLRIQFWEKCGFTITEYIHTYIWVPETYRAMYMKLDKGGQAYQLDGKSLFRHISSFHEKSFRK